METSRDPALVAARPSQRLDAIPIPPGRAVSHSLGKTLSLLEVAEDPTLAGDEQATLFKHAAELAGA